MLVEMAVADAYAIGWEFTDKQTGLNDFSAFRQHPTYAALTPGQYTDDTQRAIANIDVMLSDNPADLFSPLTYATSYVQAYKRDPREGYSRGYQAFLDTVDDGGQFLAKVQKVKDSNGSVMGVAPLGFITDIPSLKMAAAIQALTTHHSSTVLHAQLVALTMHYFVHGLGSPPHLVEFLMDNADWLDKGQDRTLWLGQLAEYYYDDTKKTTIKASSISAYVAYIAAQPRFETLTEIMHDAVERGGDTDSAAASSVAVASMIGHQNDIPEHLIDDMDQANPGFGTAFLQNLEDQLRKKYVA